MSARNKDKEIRTGSRKIGSPTLWIASRTLLTGQVVEFFSLRKKAAGKFKQDDVHDLRVASRRFREGLALFSPCFAGPPTRRLLKQVKKVTRLLGDLRNTDEAFLFFSSLTPEESAGSGPEIEGLFATLIDRRQQAQKILHKELGAPNPAPLRRRFRALANRPNLFRNSAVDPFTEIDFFAADAIGERAQTLNELLPQAVKEDNHPAQHELRIAVKRMRYRLEIIAPLLKDGYQDLHASLKEYQDLLGKLHDIDVFAGMVQEQLPEGAGGKGVLRAMTGRRSRLFEAFEELLGRTPLERIGAAIIDALDSTPRQAP